MRNYLNKTIGLKAIPFLLIGICLLFGCSYTSKLSKKEKKEEDTKSYNAFIPYYKVVASKMNIGKNDTICDIAGGYGFSISILSQYLPSSTIYYEEDINKDLCNRHQFNKLFHYFNANCNIDNYRFKTGRKSHIPYKDNSFNNIVVFISLHEFKYPYKMLDEIARILRKDGKLTIMESVYKDTLYHDKGCGFDHLSVKRLYEIMDSSKFNIVFDTSLSDNGIIGDKFAKLLICKKKK